ncbi:nucleotide kinase domain-containing protein [Spirillospora sp. NPDC048819]|uniref:nucleotide kinase domain-containing protein n=1 Tax=Spirillospora sp. NPDC048819 TaxID=3155268 RepID=UPI0033F35B71
MAVATIGQGEAGAAGLAEVAIAGRRLRPTAVFDTYWRFAAERQEVYRRKLAGQAPPWTSDPILGAHRFTNCYRASDRVSQYLIGQVSYRGDQQWREVFFRTLLFKLFNRISTWRLLSAAVGEVSWSGYRRQAYEAVLGAALERGQRIYSPAYLMPQPPLGADRKHGNHLRLLELMMADGAPERVAEAPSMEHAFEVLKGYPGLGRFLAFQFLIDLNYSSLLAFEEMDFVVAGPGACDGIRKCFGPASAGIEAEVIRYVTDTQQQHFQRLGLDFEGLGGRRPLQLIDCQNLFCETDKYARVAHPEVSGISGRVRIKQTYRADTAPMTAWFPPKWKINGEELPPADPHAR